jgi:DDE superfamily endonuclease
MVIYKGKHLQGHWFDSNAPKDWLVTTSPKGWTSNALGLKWLEYFELTTRSQDNRYRFLILDGHGSYLTPEFQDFCSQHKIILLCLPLYTLYILQPLNIAIFSPLKYYFSRTIERRLQAGAMNFLKAEFLETYQKVHPQAFTMKNIKSGFRNAGLVPFNPKQALEQLLMAFTLIPLASPQQFQTPKTQQDVQQALENLESIAQEVTKKIGKATMIFHTRALIAEKKSQELLEKIKRIQEAVSRK